MVKKLRPVIARKKYENPIKDKIMALLYEKLFGPILKELKTLPKAAQKKNAKPEDALKKAIHDGKIIYEGDYFIGKFDSQTTKALKAMGAKWSPSRRAFRLDQMKILPDVKGEISKSRAIAVSVTDKIEKILQEAQGAEIQLQIFEESEATLDDLHKQLRETTPKDIEVPLAMAGYIGEELKNEYSENLNLYIKNWYDEEIIKLRKTVQKNVISGFRASELVKGIKAEYGVSENKAKFLARQETTLFVSKYREANYVEAGLEEYEWSTSGDTRVRDSHAVMDGKTCRWDDPSVYWNGIRWEARENIGGVKLHPGNDWQCRCIAIPILKERG